LTSQIFELRLYSNLIPVTTFPDLTFINPFMHSLHFDHRKFISYMWFYCSKSYEKQHLASFQRDFQMSTWLHSRLCVYWF